MFEHAAAHIARAQNNLNRAFAELASFSVLGNRRFAIFFLPSGGFRCSYIRRLEIFLPSFSSEEFFFRSMIRYCKYRCANVENYDFIVIHIRI